jgi:hypothetical protein
MTRSCTVERRGAAEDAAAQLRAQPTVADVTVLAPTEGSRDEWTVEIVVGRTRVGPRVLFAVATQGLPVESVQTRSASGTTQVVATVPG